jgi:fluoride exporter
VKKTIPLYIGLATGFCGSFTSFSTFMRDCFLALSNSSPPFQSPLSGFSDQALPRNGGFSFLALFAILIFEPAVSIGGLYVGGHLAIALDEYLPSIPFIITSRVLDRLGVVLGLGSWIGAIILCVLPPDRPMGPASTEGGTWETESWRGSVLFAIVLAPLGCITRFYASILLNTRVPSFPLGTFVVNILGSALAACFFALQHTSLGSAIGGGRVGCQLLQGAMEGFCGCLTTVSTWVLELTGLRRRAAYVYGITSLVAGVMVMVVVMGPVRWGRGFEPTACGV